MTPQPPPPAPPLRLRVFLASPGDVTDERALALKVLERLPYDPFLRGRILVETIAWDKPGDGAPRYDGFPEGLSIRLDGRQVAHSERMERLTVDLGALAPASGPPSETSS